MSEAGSAHGGVTLGIVDNDAMVLRFLNRLFAPETVPIRVLWTVDNGAAALDLCGNAADRPQVVLTDLAMPHMDGMQLAKALHVRHPDLRIVAMAGFRITQTPEELHAAGIGAAVGKDVDPLRLVHVIGAAAGDDAVAHWDPNSGAWRTARSPLTGTETAVLRMYAEGKTTNAIAHQLGISVSTVKVHLRGSYAKLGVSSRPEAVAKCVREGLI
ncbi:DNA-binding response regulator [Bifidobacterium sp. DSM 109958]|uniref:DNA-binding response regulator n=1 Tax=Bifidobacterium moraviense TaxID=2675323 RepID=A0A7Y0F1K0_9BIFI|nr:response regulator transcription factor [Bifidobacterium sp. DSM 109958]NMN00316.1 DNA-binding response regulator [Bifidobacterium sp. DSM 109958]